MNDNISRTITPNPPANYTPSMGKYQTLQPFRYWCQKVLPLVYDDSLSYYELLCKVVDYLNKTMEDVETLHGDVTNLHKAYVQLQEYVNNYFSTLDVQKEINNKLDSMVQSGELLNIITPTIASNVTNWLTGHITNPSNPPIDKSLLVGNAAADSKTVGDLIFGMNIKNVSAFGAVGDGTTDDYTAFQGAINNHTINGIILDSEKTYYISKKLIMTDRQNFCIIGNNATILFENLPSEKENDTLFQIVSITGLYIENLTINGQYEWVERPYHTQESFSDYMRTRNASRHALYIANSKQFTLKNVNVNHSLTGFFITRSSYGNIINCSSQYTLADGVFVVSCRSVNVTNHYCNNIDDDSYVAINYDPTLSSSNIRYDGCITQNGFGALCCFYGSYNCSIKNSAIYNCSYTPLKLGAHNPYKVGGGRITVENCNIIMKTVVDNFTDNLLTLCEGITEGDNTFCLSLKNITINFPSPEKYTCRIISTDDIEMKNVRINTPFSFVSCDKVSMSNCTLKNVQVTKSTYLYIVNNNIYDINITNASSMEIINNRYTNTPVLTFYGTNSKARIDNNNINNKGNNYFIQTSDPALPKDISHLSFLVGTVLSSGGRLIYVTDSGIGYKVLATE